jgi:hypothetical protein
MSGIEQKAVAGTGRSGDMATFTFYIRDDRFIVLAMDFVSAESVAGARMYAAGWLMASKHHTAVDVYEGEDFRFSVTAGSAARRLI